MAQHYPRYPVPGPVVIPNCAQVSITWLQNSMVIMNVLHGNLTAAGPLNPNIAETIFSALKANAATTTWLTHVTTGMSLTGVRVKDLRAANNPTLLSTGVAVLGTGAGAAVPQDCALAVTLRTAFSGKGYVGRAYLGGLTVTDLADSRHWASGVQTPAINFMNAINSAMTASGLPWVLAQRQLAGNPDPAAPPSQQQPRPAGVVPITAANLTDLRVDSQRRRLGRK